MGKPEKDPILTESKFCEDCEPKVLQLVEYVRNLENTLIVAKQAIESLQALNEKLTNKHHILINDYRKARKQIRNQAADNIKDLTDEIDKAEARFVNRKNLLS